MARSDLLENIKKVLSSADLIYSKGDFTSATILYFKAAFNILDLILLNFSGKSPKDHTERFRMLEDSHPDLYQFLDKYFKIYRDTYTTSIDKETCKMVKENVGKIIERYKIQI